MCLVHRSKRLRPNSQNLRKTSSLGSSGPQVLARRPFLQTASRIFNAARPIDIMAATTSFSWGRSRPMRTIGTSPCCLLAAVTERFSPKIFLGPKGPNDKENIPHARAYQAEAAIAGRSRVGNVFCIIWTLWAQEYRWRETLRNRREQTAGARADCTHRPRPPPGK